MKFLKNKKFRILIVLILIYFLLEFSFLIIRYNFTTYVETEDGKIQIYAVDEFLFRNEEYAYAWSNVDMDEDELKKVNNLNVTVLDVDNEVVEKREFEYFPPLECASLDNSLLMGLSLWNENVNCIMCHFNLTPKYSIIHESMECKYKIEYEYNGKLIEEVIKPKRVFRMPDDTLLEILISYLL